MSSGGPHGKTLSLTLSSYLKLDLRKITFTMEAVLLDQGDATLTRHRIIIGDCREMLEVADESVHLVVTSPPYWQLKDYGPSRSATMIPMRTILII